MSTVVRRLLGSVFIAVLLFAVPASKVAAHGSSFNFKYVDGPNVIMITHNVHDPHAGVPLTYNIRLYNLTGQAVPFNKLETEFTLDGRTVYKKTFAPSSNNDVMLTYTYPKEGNYMLHTRILQNGTQIIKGEFPLVVEKGLEESPASFFNLRTGFAFIIGIIVSSAYWQQRAMRQTVRTKKSKTGPAPKN
jgi:hypothetical protein